MRSLLELVLLGAIIALSWEKSLSERVGDVIPGFVARDRAPVLMGGHTARARAVSGSPAESQPGAWMWDANRRSTLDRPAYNDSRTFTGHIYYIDDHGRKYRLDGSGKRHYDQ